MVAWGDPIPPRRRGGDRELVAWLVLGPIIIFGAPLALIFLPELVSWIQAELERVLTTYHLEAR